MAATRRKKRKASPAERLEKLERLAEGIVKVMQFVQLDHKPDCATRTPVPGPGGYSIAPCSCGALAAVDAFLDATEPA